MARLAAVLLAAALVGAPAAAHDDRPRNVRPHGHFRHEVRVQIPGTKAGVVGEKRPAISLRVEDEIAELILFGPDGEPFARFGRGGVEVNEASPTWALTARERGTFQTDAPVDAGAAPRWRPESQSAQLTWLEPRAVAPREAADFEWSVPGRLDGQPVSLRGRSVWEPPPVGGVGGLGVAMPGLVVAVAGMCAFAGAAFSRRRRARRAAH